MGPKVRILQRGCVLVSPPKPPQVQFDASSRLPTAPLAPPSEPSITRRSALRKLSTLSSHEELRQVVLSELPASLEIGVPVTASDQFLKQFNFGSWEEDLAELIRQLIAWPLSAGWVAAVDLSGRTYYSNTRSKAQQWTHPFLPIFQMIIQAYRLSNGKATVVIQSLSRSRRNLLASKRKWQKSLGGYFNEETLQSRADNPADEIRAQTELLDAAIVELWIVCVLREQRNFERLRGGDPVTTWFTGPALHATANLSADAAKVLEKVLAFPLPPPWVAEFLEVDQKPLFLNKDAKVTSDKHPCMEFFQKLGKAAGVAFELAKLLTAEKNAAVSDARLLRLLAIRQVWKSTCVVKFPVHVADIFAWSPSYDDSWDVHDLQTLTYENVTLIVPIKEERPSTGGHSRVKARTVATFPEFEQMPLRMRVKRKQDLHPVEVKTEPEKAKETEPITRLEAVGILTDIFKKDLMLAMLSLANQWGDITRDSFLKYMTSLPAGLCSASPTEMFEALDTMKTGILVRSDFVLADDGPTNIADRILSEVCTVLIRAVAQKVSQLKRKPKPKQRPH